MAAQLEQLRLRLLDLTGRNRLLNLRHTAGRSLQFASAGFDRIFTELAGGDKIQLRPLPQPSAADWKEQDGRTTRPDPRDWAQRKGIPTSYEISQIPIPPREMDLQTLLYPEDLVRHSRKLARETRLAFEETGANMLFVVLGFLEFPDVRGSDRIFSAPLVAVPVELKPADRRGEKYAVLYSGEDIEENLALREKLKRDFELHLPELDGEELSPTSYIDRVRDTVKSEPHFRVKFGATLCLLSFTNMLLYRDLEPGRWPEEGGKHALLDHPQLRQIFGVETPAQTVPSDLTLEDLDDAALDAEAWLVFDADSSQHKALAAVLRGENLVIQGPPGTGKSQTIANTLASCIRLGRKVLFVAEKAAAIEVVKNRLERIGLGSFATELHSHRANRKSLLQALDARLAFDRPFSPKLNAQCTELEANRKLLNEYIARLSSTFGNNLGLTLHEMIWCSERYRGAAGTLPEAIARLHIDNASEISGAELAERLSSLRRIANLFPAVGQFGSYSPAHPLWGFTPTRHAPGDEERLIARCQSSLVAAKRLVTTATALAQLADSTVFPLEPTAIESQIQILTECAAKLPPHCCDLLPSLAEPARRELGGAAIVRLRAQIAELENSLPAVTAGVFDESRASDEIQSALHHANSNARRLGAILGNTEEIALASLRVSEMTERAQAANRVAESWCRDHALPWTGAEREIATYKRLCEALGGLNPEQLAADLPRLGLPGAAAALRVLSQDLACFQADWTELSARFYLDDQPALAGLRVAITTLRQGAGWFKWLKPDWRRSIRLHHNLQHVKARATATERLADLERMASILDRRSGILAAKVWATFLPGIAPSTDISVADFCALAEVHTVVATGLSELDHDEWLLGDKKLSSLRPTPSKWVALDRAISELLASLAEMKALLPGITLESAPRAILAAREFCQIMESLLGWMRTSCPAAASFEAILAAVDAACRRKAIAAVAAADTEGVSVFGKHWAGVATDLDDLSSAIIFAGYFERCKLDRWARTVFLASPTSDTIGLLKEQLAAASSGLDAAHNFAQEMANEGGFSLQDWAGAAPRDDLVAFASGYEEHLKTAIVNSAALAPWALYLAARQAAHGTGGAQSFISAMESSSLDTRKLADAYAYRVYSSIIEDLFRAFPALGAFAGTSQAEAVERFNELDKQIIKLRAAQTATQAVAVADPPRGSNSPRVDDRSDLVLLNYLRPQKRPRMAIRKIFAKARRAILELTPCLMMGPQSVAQFLPREAGEFDLVVIDEASQLPLERAVGTIARGKQIVVVGDSKQLPPTDYFTRAGTTNEEDEFAAIATESVLEACITCFPERHLRWHYRSRHETLIAFSNRHFYKDELIVAPSPHAADTGLGITGIYLKDAVYRDQMNTLEARRVVSAAVEHILTRPDDSLGVVTLNLKQRDLIDELLEERLKNVADAEKYLERWREAGSPLFVKNLETVQGDERDAIIIGTTFGPGTPGGPTRQNFGPISRVDGWRRLNVLFTRARKSVLLITSMQPEDIIIGPDTPDGTRTLRNYLEYARSGILPAVGVGGITGLGPDSDFEVAVADLLRRNGYDTTPQLGVAGFRIDIAVKHPKVIGAYLAAIECDGAYYHSSQYARDRDRIRERIICDQGWEGRVWRIWSTDWFRNPIAEARRLLDFLQRLADSWIPAQPAGRRWKQEGSEPGDTTLMTEAEALVPVAEPEYIEARTGDTIHFVFLEDGAEPRRATISRDTSDPDQYIYAVGSPLARALLEAAVGDERELRVPGQPPRMIRVLEISRPSAESSASS